MKLCERLCVLLLLLFVRPVEPACDDQSSCVKANAAWRTELINSLNEFKSCRTSVDDSSPCNYFLARALKRVYGIDDFLVAGKPEQPMRANDIAGYVLAHPELWTKLGEAKDKNVLKEAQGYADTNKAIIAVKSETGGPGHVALILPGRAAASSAWGQSEPCVPCAASFLLNHPDKAFVGCSLAYAWQKPDGVLIYGRNH